MNNPLQLDALTLPIKYIALCKIMSEISESFETIEEVDAKVELFIVETNFQALDVGFEEVHLNG
jgi:hypothetical protein